MTELFERYDEYCAAREGALARVQRGLDSQPALLEIDAQFDDLTSGDALPGLQRECEGAGSAVHRQELARLIYWVQGAAIESSGRALELELRTAQQSRLSASRVAALREQRLAALGAARAKLGQPLGLDRAQARLPGVDLAAWRAAAQELLRQTQSAYSDQRALALRRAGRGPADSSAAAHADVRALQRFDPVFPAERLRALLEFACEPLGAALAACRWVQAARGAARCWPVRVPREVLLAVPERGGALACAELFAAAGAGMALAQCGAELPLALRRPWDAALGYAFAALLRRRLADPHWLAELPSGPHADDLAVALPAAEQARLRAAAGRLQFEWALAVLPAESDPRRLSALYAQCMLEASGFEHPADLYLVAAQSALPVLDLLRGECLAAQLAAALRTRFGRRYWRAPGCARLLRELWAEGSRYTAEELAASLDLGPLELTGFARGELGS